MRIETNGHCPRCIGGWIMPPDRWGDPGCLNCGFYLYDRNGEGDYEEAFGHEVVTLVAKPMPLRMTRTTMSERPVGKKKKRAQQIFLRLPSLTMGGNHSEGNRIVTLTFTKRHKIIVIKTTQAMEGDIRNEYENRGFSLQKHSGKG